MTEEEKENPETPETGEETTSKNQEGEETPQSPEAEKPEEKSKELQSALAQKEHYRKKLEELQASQKDTPETSKAPETSKKEAKEEWTAPNDPIELAKLGKVLGKYSDEETEFIMRNAPSRDLAGIMKAEQDQMVQSAIQSQREKVEKEKQTPPPSTKQVPSETNLEEVPPDQIKSLNPDQQEKWVELQRKKAGKGGFPQK